MAAPDRLDQTLAALKYAGASRAKFYPDGTLEEVEFAPEVPEVVAAPQMASVPVALDSPRVIDVPGVHMPGYAQLFSSGAPRFQPADE